MQSKIPKRSASAENIHRRSKAAPIRRAHSDTALSRQRAEPEPVQQQSRENSSQPGQSNLLAKISINSQESRTYRDSDVEVNPPAIIVRQGEETHSRRDVVTRMLDRITRLLLNPAIKEPQTEKKVKPKDKFAIKTPHLAAVKLGKDIHIAGNSGDKRVRELHQKEGLNRVLVLVEKLEHGAGDAGRYEKDFRKLEMLLQARYHQGEDISDELNQIKVVLEGHLLKWHQVDKKESDKGSVHGEMALHGPMLNHAKNNPRDKSAPKAPIPVAGVKRDCLFCQWAHAILNEHVYADLGYEISTAGTHGVPFPNWKAPQELMENNNALIAFKERLQDLNHDGTLWTMDEAGKVTLDGHAEKINNSHDPYESESDVE